MELKGYSVDGVLEFSFAMAMLVYRIDFLHAGHRFEVWKALLCYSMARDEKEYITTYNLLHAT